MFTTQNIIIAVAVVIAIVLVIYFVSQAGKRNRNKITLATSDGNVEIELPAGNMDEEDYARHVETEVRLDALTLTTPVSVPLDAFPLRMGSEGIRVRQLQNYLYNQHRHLYTESPALDFQSAGEAGKWGNYTQAFVKKMMGEETIEKGMSEDVFNKLRLPNYNYGLNLLQNDI